MDDFDMFGRQGQQSGDLQDFQELQETPQSNQEQNIASQQKHDTQERDSINVEQLEQQYQQLLPFQSPFSSRQNQQPSHHQLQTLQREQHERHQQHQHQQQRHQQQFQQQQQPKEQQTTFSTSLQFEQQQTSPQSFENQPDYASIFGIDQFDMNKEFKHEFQSPEQLDRPDLAQTISFNMPGAFKSDSMDLDESPPFTIDSNIFIEPALTTSRGEAFTKPTTSIQKAEASVSPFDDSSRVSSYTNVNYDNILSGNNHNGQAFNDLASENFHKGSIDSYYQTTNNQNVLQVPRNHSFSNASLNVNNNNLYSELSPLTTTTSLTPSVGSVHSTQPSFFSANQYITRNSLDQPPSSLHRPSFDYYSKNRASMESQQSSQHQRNQTGSGGRYTSFTNSITNMLPFMGDRSQRSPISGPSSPQGQVISSQSHQPQQSRHLIRSIFKGSINNANSESAFEHDNNNQTAFMAESGTNEDNFGSMEADQDILMSPLKDELDYDGIETSVPIKKAKRSKRSLFTRFKTPVKAEPTDEFENARPSDEIPVPSQKSLVDNESLENSMTGNVSLQASSISGTPSTATTNNANVLDATSSNNSHGGQSQAQPEPDYAALFENVGKRKHIVNTSSYRKPKTKIKTEPLDGFDKRVKTEPSDGFEKPSLLSFGNKSKKNDGDESTNALSLFSGRSLDNHDRSSQSDGISATSSNGSSFQYSNSRKSGEDVDNTSSSLANASKRILGSKLALGKKNAPARVPAASMISKGVEVEVDLGSLDLPPDTQIFPTSMINAKNRTRGRKENKEADMVDQTKIYLCNYCSRRFKRQEHLKRHFRSLHTLEKPYDCTICNKKFSRSDNLNQHLKTHKQEEEEMARLAQEGGLDVNMVSVKEEEIE